MPWIDALMADAVGAFLAERGFRLISALAGRSELTRVRAERAGIEDAIRIFAKYLPPPRGDAPASDD